MGYQLITRFKRGCRRKVKNRKSNQCAKHISALNIEIGRERAMDNSMQKIKSLDVSPPVATCCRLCHLCRSACQGEDSFWFPLKLPVWRERSGVRSGLPFQVRREAWSVQKLEGQELNQLPDHRHGVEAASSIRPSGLRPRGLKKTSW